MTDFPDEIIYPSGNKLQIDTNRWLLSLKKSYTLTQVTNHLTQWSIILIGSSNPNEKINHTNTRFWIYSDNVSSCFLPSNRLDAAA